MAQITTVKLASNTFPKKELSQPFPTITTRFSPTELSADVSSGDAIVLADLPKRARVIGAGVRVIGAVGEANCFLQAQINENSTTYKITDPLSATYSGSAAMVSAPPPVNDDYIKSWELLIAGGNFDNSATGILEATIRYEEYVEAG